MPSNSRRLLSRLWPVALTLIVTAGAASPTVAVVPDAQIKPAIEALNTSRFEQKTTAIEALGALDDERAARTLEALGRGQLYVHPDGQIVTAERHGNDYRIHNAITGAAVAEISKRKLKKIKVNNKLRRLIRGLVGQNDLLSDDANTRLKALDQILKSPNAGSLKLLKRAHANEVDPTLRDRLETGIAILELNAAEVPLRRAAAISLAGQTKPEIRSQLEQRLSLEDDAKVREALEHSIESITEKLWLLSIGENLIFGISLGSVLLLAAIGLAITFGVMGVINLAHGEMIMLGAYSTFVVQELFRAFVPPELFGFYLLAAVPMAFLVAGGFGILIERGCIRFLYGRPLETLLATWGVSLILQQLVRSLFGANNREVANPEFISGAVELIGGISVTLNRIYIVFFCLAVVALLALFIRYTRFGLNMRAVTQNRAMAASMGINTHRVDALTFALGSGTAGMAGVALSQISNVSPNLGQNFIVDSFMVVVFGGVGSLWGTIVGAFSLGILNKFLEPVSGAILGKIVVLVLIILFIQMRPQGLFALKGRGN